MGETGGTCMRQGAVWESLSVAIAALCTAWVAFEPAGKADIRVDKLKLMIIVALGYSRSTNYRVRLQL